MNESPRSDFSDNPATHREIRTMLAHFNEPSRTRMRTKIGHDRAAVRDQGTGQADATARHTYHEFVFGVHLKQLGFDPEYGRRIGSKTPDWFDPSARLLVEVFTCERGGTTAPGLRAAGRISQKVRKYSETVQEHGVSFVVAVHGDGLSGLSAGDCEGAIADHRLFATHPDLSGILYFSQIVAPPSESARKGAQRAATHAFTYFANPLASRAFELH